MPPNFLQLWKVGEKYQEHLELNAIPGIKCVTVRKDSTVRFLFHLDSIDVQS